MGRKEHDPSEFPYCGTKSDPLTPDESDSGDSTSLCHATPLGRQDHW